MPRGGRGGGRGGKRGPDMSWDDDEPTEVTPNTRKPGPLFPERYFPVPKPLTGAEKASVASLISFRDRIRRGPLYATLDPTIALSSTTTKNTYQNSAFTSRRDQLPSDTSRPNPRIGFDPFNDQEKYTMKYHRKKRTVPDLSERDGYTLRLFPLELWSTLDPKRRMKEWETLTDEQRARVSGPTVATTRGRKRKRGQALKFADDEDDTALARDRRGSDSEASVNDDDDDDDVVSPNRRRRNKRETRKNDKHEATRQKKGLDAEDDYPDVDQDNKNDDDDADGNNNGEANGEDEPGDSEFETDEDEEDGMDDYNAEQYFDDGADDGDGGYGGGDGDDDGGGGGYY